ncbi:predicted protein [Lichtheimia corymbifera JMRC:FSU:9682]|uniref:Uncharacterized protein n=1 Tax=Lichtheimia corymbifera JMRC:FSU:9682 TaxID=1263082 RepID=A0A068S9F8_9FUNG|nr:predicted protein [Lichtheimia corymbifera JMRC:FSU:9682]
MGIVESNRANAHRPTNQHQWITMNAETMRLTRGQFTIKGLHDDDAKRTMYHSMGVMSYSVIITIQDADVILKRVENFVCGTL